MKAPTVSASVAAWRLPWVRRVLRGAALLWVVVGPDVFAASAVDMQSALDTHGQLVNETLQARFEHIAQQLRCLVCQNESIADSNVELASDLRRQVREMLVAGNSDAAIFQFMTDRYGEFVRFSPPLEAKTVLIWGAPFIVLAAGALIIVSVTRRRASMPVDEEPPLDQH